MKEWLKNNRHYIYCLYLPIYLLMFFIVEKVITGTSDYWVSYSTTDDLIPFIDWFIIFYYLWYPTLFGLGIWLIIKDKQAFERYMLMIMIGFSLSIITFYIFPNGQNLRVADTGATIFSKLVSYTYSIDTNTNVLPSIHAYAGIIAMVAFIDTNSIKQWWIKSIFSVLCLLSAISTVFVKQHSIIDIYAAIIMFIPIFLLVYRKKVFKKTHRLAFMAPMTLPSYSAIDIDINAETKTNTDEATEINTDEQCEQEIINDTTNTTNNID